MYYAYCWLIGAIALSNKIIAYGVCFQLQQPSAQSSYYSSTKAAIQHTVSKGASASSFLLLLYGVAGDEEDDGALREDIE